MGEETRRLAQRREAQPLIATSKGPAVGSLALVTISLTNVNPLEGARRAGKTWRSDTDQLCRAIDNERSNERTTRSTSEGARDKQMTRAGTGGSCDKKGKKTEKQMSRQRSGATTQRKDKKKTVQLGCHFIACHDHGDRPSL